LVLEKTVRLDFTKIVFVHPILDHISAIIFDLGEVIIDVDTSKTVNAFKALANENDINMFSFSHQADFFSQFEMGLISEDEFRANLRSSLKTDASDETLNVAWNKMLGDLPQEKLNILQRLKSDYRTFALSTTNTIHIRFINDYLQHRKPQDKLDNYFHHAYYSHDLKARKPNDIAYTKVMALENLIPQQTLMIDDRLENLQAASDLGLRVFHMTDPSLFYQLF
jgi:putative hydrolase of the HAD superfamily